MILAGKDIAILLKSGLNAKSPNDPLVILPFNDLSTLESSGSASIDLRLGTWFLTLQQARIPHLQIDAPTPTSQVSRLQYVSFSELYTLHPGSFVLGTTLEWLRIPKNLAAEVTGKSSWGRSGLIIETAPMVHPGFKGCLTLELTNVGELPVQLRPGIKICQLMLQEMKRSHRKRGQMDQSRFIGMRKPAFAEIKSDETCRKLAL